MIIQFISTGTRAQFTKLVDFGSESDGHIPYSAPISDGGTYLYGMTYQGGAYNQGTVYKVKTDGTGFAKLLDFDGTNGANPYGSLFFDGTFLYGMTSAGGANSVGVIFKMKTDGSGFITIFDFDYFNTGAYARGSLISDGTFLYGMTTAGGLTYGGTVFKIKPDGTGYVKLHEFNVDNNGYLPYGSLITDGTYLYGMTSGGNSYFGTLFKIKTDGTGFSNLVSFANSLTGRIPYGSLVSDGTFFYGMTLAGGNNDLGTLFKIKPDGTGFARILDFSNSAVGASPKGSLVYDGTFLYGMTTDYGAAGRGTIFKVKTDGSGFVKLLDGDIGTVDSNPEGGLTIQGGTLYGAKSGGGAGSAPFLPGAIFKINTDGSGYAKLHTFEVEGSKPNGSLFFDGTYLYGTTNEGGLYDYGTIFKVKPDKTGYTRLMDFLDVSNGKNPTGRLISDGTFLYGLTTGGGVNGEGVIYKIKPDGSGYVKLLDFDGTNNGGGPNGSLISDGTFLYGMTSHGGANSYGTIFKIKPDGTGYQKLLDFDYDNNGAYPNGSLIGVSGILYGMTNNGGMNGWGTLFKIGSDGSGFAKLLDFDNDNTGGNPNASLVYDGTFLYGMASGGGSNGEGTIFKVKPDGSAFLKLLDFDSKNTGAVPYGSLTSAGTSLYGMTNRGGTLNKGAIFKINIDGSGFLKLYDFNDGSGPQASLVSDGTYLYGMTESGGVHYKGILFRTSMTPYVSITDFTPAEGSVGTYVVINGNNFDPVTSNNVVKFNGTAATVISATATKLVVVVPLGATTGPIFVKSGATSDTSIDNFTVTLETGMFNGTVQNCNVNMNGTNSGSDGAETFLPVNPGDKVKISFISFNVGDELNIYDGPDTSSPLLASLSGSSIPNDFIAKGATGALTLEFIWHDSDSEWEANISCQSPNGPAIVIAPQPSDATVCAGDIAKFITAASGTSNLMFEWQFSNASAGPFMDITNPTAGYTGMSTSTLSVNTTGGFGAGFYRCIVSGDAVSFVFTNVAQLTVNTTGCGPAIATSPLTAQIGGTVTLDLTPLITTPNSSLDISSLQIVTPPLSGAAASIDATGRLSIDYAGKSFSGEDQVTIRACDTNGKCATQVFIIEVGGDLTVFNGVSPNGNFFKVLNIDALPETKNNTVYIFDRWENVVWHGSNYDNASVKFTGVGDNGTELPSGVYFYKIEFSGGHKNITGFISLRK